MDLRISNFKTNSNNCKNYRTENHSKNVNFEKVIKTDIIWRSTELKPDEVDGLEVINKFLGNILRLTGYKHINGQKFREGFKAFEPEYTEPLKISEKISFPVSITSPYNGNELTQQYAILTGVDSKAATEEGGMVFLKGEEMFDDMSQRLDTFLSEQLQKIHEKFYAKAEPDKTIRLYAVKTQKGIKLEDAEFISSSSLAQK